MVVNVKEPDLSSLNILISGQTKTSRTETIEDYLRPRVRKLGVIAIASPFTKADIARFREYDSGEITREQKISSVYVKNRNSFLGVLLLTWAFVKYFINIFRLAFKTKWHIDYFIGVSCFSSFVGVFLKWLKRVDRLVYYSIDYYIMPPKFCFDSIIVWAFRKIDRLCARNADMVWHITRRIEDGRAQYSGFKRTQYKHCEVPMCYDESVFRTYPLDQVQRWTIGFVGTISDNQGWGLLIRSIPDLVKRFPKIKVSIIGRGPYADELERMVKESGFENRFIFHGFIQEDERAYNIIGHTAVGVALWTKSEDNNISYADTGKPKLYTCLGVPCVITPPMADTGGIEKNGAGVTIDYEKGQLVEAVTRIISDDKVWAQFREKACKLRLEFSSEKIFGRVVAETCAGGK
jgi:glycosyltransferase involved in cell wall biosynthesis